jgi:hypothetical protein
MQDIAPNNQRRSIRDIKKSDLQQFPSSRHIREESEVHPPSNESEHDDRFDQEVHEEFRPRPRRSKIWLWLAAAIGLCIVAFAITSLFTYATVYITPVQTDITLNGALDAYRTPGAGQLAFQTITATKTVTKSLPATKEENVNRRASGTIVVYNEYSSQVQRLVKNTRFATPDGKIYRIMNSIEVPGVTVTGGQTVPGSIEVVVYADEGGASYNIGLTDFTIPGLKGDPRYSKFYARSKTPMTGGFTGVMKTVDDDAFKVAQTDLQAELKTELLAQAKTELAAGSILFDDAAQYTFQGDELPPAAQGDTVTVSETGTLTAAIFDTLQLSQFLARQALGATYDGSPVLIDNLATLSFSMIDKTKYAPATQPKVSFNLQGTGHLIWQIDQDAITAALAGVPKDTFNDTVGKVTGIKKAHATIRPLWSGHFPGNKNRISISFEDVETATSTGGGE